MLRQRGIVKVAMAIGSITAASALLPGPVPARSVSRTCPPPGATITAHSGLARAYRSNGTLYACRGRIRITLGPAASNDQTSSCIGTAVRIVRLSARFVAWHEDDECRDLSTWRIKVRALRSGTKTRTFLTGSNACGDSCPRFGVGPARQLVLDARGNVAWIARDDAIATPTFEVWRAKAAETPKRLARGSDISPTYLRLKDDRVVWQQAGELRSG